ncbi:S26 family signal peptidase [Streptomyces sp. NPDC059788]|uniref:S26 family signal peptidase n=1 Tax=Streptomyces sp. NPDC059788 TaxID=3346948 RepID=UPI00366660D9
MTGRPGRHDVRLAPLLLSAACTATAVGVLLRLRRGLVAVTVRGMSMEPAYRDGDRVLVRSATAFVPGQVVVVERPCDEAGRWGRPPVRTTDGPAALTRRHWLIKRVAAAPGDRIPHDRDPALRHLQGSRVPPGKLVVLGDNTHHSFDSRHIGYVPTARVLGTVACPLTRKRSGRAALF